MFFWLSLCTFGFSGDISLPDFLPRGVAAARHALCVLSACCSCGVDSYQTRWRPARVYCTALLTRARTVVCVGLDSFHESFSRFESRSDVRCSCGHVVTSELASRNELRPPIFVRYTGLTNRYRMNHTKITCTCSVPYRYTLSKSIPAY